jgi:hypothetical protein
MPVVPLAYKFVATAVMLMEINHCASQLQLPVRLPLKESDVRVAVFPPKVIGFAGRVDTTNFSFSFAKSGRLRFITRLENGYQAYSTTKAQGDLRTSEFLPQLVSVHSTIDTNGAYKLATNWLAKIDVDVARLQHDNPAISTQQSLNGYGPIPVFYVDWGQFQQRSGPAVRVMIAGDTKDILYLRQEDDSYSRRPTELIKGVDKLLAIPDEEFLKYSPLERSNLIASFAAVSYTPADPSVGAKGQH